MSNLSHMKKSFLLATGITMLAPLVLSAQSNRIEQTGNVGIGITNPSAPLHIVNGQQQFRFGTGTATSGFILDVGLNDDGANFYLNTPQRGFNFKKSNNTLFSILPTGHLVLETGSNPIIYTGTGGTELNRYISLINSPVLSSASGLKAGGILVSGDYNFASPDKNDLVVKGMAGFGVPTPEAKLDIAGGPSWTSNGWAKGIRLAKSNAIEFTSVDRSFGFGTTSNMFYYFHAKADGTGPANYYMMVNGNTGNISIGNINPSDNYKLVVDGAIGARRLKVTQGSWADFVFHPDYKLPSLPELEKYVKENRHMPDIPSEQEVLKEGIDVGEMNKKLLQKVEELTLYLIEESKKNEQLMQEVMQLRNSTKALEEKVARMRL